MDRREELRSELIQTLERMGYPQDFGRAIANQLGSEMTMSRMIGYLQHARPASAEEIDEQDIHQIIVIGVAAIVPHNALADSLMDEISVFVESNIEAEILEEIREIR